MMCLVGKSMMVVVVVGAEAGGRRKRTSKKKPKNKANRIVTSALKQYCSGLVQK